MSFTGLSAPGGIALSQLATGDRIISIIQVGGSQAAGAPAAWADITKHFSPLAYSGQLYQIDSTPLGSSSCLALLSRAQLTHAIGNV